MFVGPAKVGLRYSLHYLGPVGTCLYGKKKDGLHSSNIGYLSIIKFISLCSGYKYTFYDNSELFFL